MGFFGVELNSDGLGRARGGLGLGDWLLLLVVVLLFAGVAGAEPAEDADGDSRILIPPVKTADESRGSPNVEPLIESMSSPASPADLEEAVRKAEAAADEAWAAARSADQRARDAERRHEQHGPYLGAGFAYAAEDFDDSIIVKSSVAGTVFAGYRFRRFFSADIRYEGFDGFDLESSRGHGEIDGYAITINGKMRPFEGPIQPVIGIGVGGIRLETDFVFNDGTRFDQSESAFVFRMSGGIDLPLNDHVMVNLEGAYLIPGDDLSDLETGMLSAGLTYVF